MKLHVRNTQLSKWVLGEEDIEWSNLVRSSGLSHLQWSMYRKHNASLINAFVERWHPETNSFHMTFGEMTITLHDVHFLLGLSIMGDVVSSERDPKVVLKELVEELEFPNDQLIAGEVTRRGFPYAVLVEHCKQDRVQDESPRAVATSFLLYLLCLTIFVDKTQNRLSLAYLPVICDHDRVSSLSWGSAALAYQYYRLVEATRRDCNQMCGRMTLLEAWIYAYFPKFRRATSSDWDRETEPFATQWRGAPLPSAPLPNYRQMLDDLRADEVDWMPYGELDFYNPVIAPSRFHGLIACLGTNEPYMPDRVARQFGRQQNVPSSVISP